MEEFMKRRRNYILSLLVILGSVAALLLGASSGRISRVFHQAYASESASRPTKKDTVSDLRIGIISYWHRTSLADWDSVPANSLGMINPDSGILDPTSDNVNSD